MRFRMSQRSLQGYIGARQEVRGRCKFGTSGYMAVSILAPIVRSCCCIESFAAIRMDER